MHSTRMQILYAPFLQHRSNKVKRFLKVLSLIFLVLLGISCTRSDFSLVSLQHGVSYVTLLNAKGEVVDAFESLSLYVETEDSEASDLQMEVSSPDGASIWNFQAEKRVVNKTTYHGSSSLVMGNNIPLMQGEWTVQVLNADGRTLSDTFILETYPNRRIPKEVVFDPLKGDLQIDSDGSEYRIQLLDAKKKILYESLQTQQVLHVRDYFVQWNRVKYIVLAYFDDTTNMTELIHISL